MNDEKVTVLVVEDSSVARELLVHILSADPQVIVIGTATNGAEAVKFLQQQAPRVVLMDIQMPEMDGFEATRRIMETRPVPIVICSSNADPREALTIFQSMQAGAVACIEKPVGLRHPNYATISAQLVQTVKLMAEVKVIRRWPRSRHDATLPEVPSASHALHMLPKVEVIGIGASTGGPPVLQTILTGLPKDFPAPLMIVQHIAHGFLQGLADWLTQTTGVQVHVADFGLQMQPGHAYLAPDDFHLAARPGGQYFLSKENPEEGVRPAVSHLFRSLAKVYGAAAIGVLLTGMGKDGAKELKLMKDAGAVTIVQDRESSVVHGMPGQAIILGAATHVLPADKIAAMLSTLVRQRTH